MPDVEAGAGWVRLTMLALLPAMASLLVPGPSTATTPTPAGVWMWDDGTAAVEFHRCFEALCGRIVWLKQESLPNARPSLDTRNPEANPRRRRIRGIDYIAGVKATTGGDWKAGRIYDFNSGSSYDLDIDWVGPAQIKMRGYKGMRIFGANLAPVRPPADLGRCRTETRNEREPPQ